MISELGLSPVFSDESSKSVVESENVSINKRVVPRLKGVWVGYKLMDSPQLGQSQHGQHYLSVFQRVGNKRVDLDLDVLSCTKY